MKLQKATARELKHIAIGVLLGSAVMVGIFALAGKFDSSVLWGALLGSAVAIANFFYLGISVQKASANTERAMLVMKSSYTIRMLICVVALVVGFVSPLFHWLAVIIPLLLPRVTIYVMQMLGMYKPEKKPADDTKEEE